MRKFKGIELPVNSVIIIALAIFVLLMLAAFFGKSGGEMDRTQLQSSFNQACYQLSSANNCDPEKAKTMMSGYISNGKALSFMEVCRTYLNDMLANEDRCVKACPQCTTQYVTSGSPCPNGAADCKSPYGDLTCMSGICCASTDNVVNGHCQSGSITAGTCTAASCSPVCSTGKTCTWSAADNACKCV